jgi:hypothetical protein
MIYCRTSEILNYDLGWVKGLARSRKPVQGRLKAAIGNGNENHRLVYPEKGLAEKGDVYLLVLAGGLLFCFPGFFKVLF